MKAREYRQFSDENLEKMLKNLKLELIKANHISGQAKIKRSKGETIKGNVNLVKNIKKEIARIRTIQNERKML